MTAAVDVAVVGGGPAGITCASALARAGGTVVLFDASGFGGQLLQVETVSGVPGVPDGSPGWDAVADLIEQLGASGVRSEFARVEAIESSDGLWQLTGAGTSGVLARTVVLAIGTEPRKLDVPGAAELTGHGVSYCAACDAPIYSGRRVALVGRGHWADTELASLATHASHVLHVADTATEPAGQPGAGAVVEAVAGRTTAVEGNGKVEAIRYEQEGASTQAPVDAVFVDLGRVPSQVPVPAAEPWLDGGYVTVDETLAVTSAPGLFAIGEIRANCAPNVAAATSDASRAVNAVLDYLAAQP